MKYMRFVCLKSVCELIFGRVCVHRGRRCEREVSIGESLLYQIFIFIPT